MRSRAPAGASSEAFPPIGTPSSADSGGENVLHAHPSEDQVFVVLQGEATWYTDAAATQVEVHIDGVGWHRER